MSAPGYIFTDAAETLDVIRAYGRAIGARLARMGRTAAERVAVAHRALDQGEIAAIPLLSSEDLDKVAEAFGEEAGEVALFGAIVG